MRLRGWTTTRLLPTTLFTLLIAVALILPAAPALALQPPPPPQDDPPVEVPRYRFVDEVVPFDPEQPLAGFWHGNVETTLGPIIVSIEITPPRDGQGAWTLVQSAAQIAPPHTPARNVVRVERTLEWEFPAEPVDQLGWVDFRATLSEDSQFLTGEMRWIGHLEEPGRMRLQRSYRALDLPDRSAYRGHIIIEEDFELPVTLVVARTPGGFWVGHLDIPDQRVAGWPLIFVEREGDRLAAQMGSRTPALFDGVVREEGRRWEGAWKALRVEAAFRLERIEGYTLPDYASLERPVPSERPQAQPRASARPQIPREPFPYLVEPVIIAHDAAGHALGATITLPEGDGPFPAVILLSASGPQDRDHVTARHPLFLVMADHFTRHGLAVIRFDDRGVGQSTGDYTRATTRDFATDAAAVYNHVRKDPRLDPAKIGFLGFDEGGLVAPLAINQVEGAAFAVLLGTPGRAGSEMQLQLLDEHLARDGFDADQRKPVLDAMRAMLAVVRDDPDEARLLPVIEAYLEAEIALRDASPTVGVPTLARRQLPRLTSPWMRFFVGHDPRPALAKLTIPVFAAMGELDRQIPADSLNAIEAALRDAGGRITARRYPGLNHLFQPASTGATAEYEQIELTISPDVLDELTRWMLARTAEDQP